MIIDCHGHYTTVPVEMENYRKQQIADVDNARPLSLGTVPISDDQIRESLEGAQLKLQRERGSDVTFFSPRASAMAHHLTSAEGNAYWASHWNDLIYRVGQLYPFAPPVGLMYVLWDADEALNRWLAKRPTLPVNLDRAHLRRVVTECRRRGYLVESLTPSGLRLHSLMAGVAAYDLPPRVQELIGEMASNLGERVYLDADLAPRRRQPVNLIAAPTFDTEGRQELVLSLHVGESVTGAEVSRRASALVAAADAVTAEMAG